ncbi:MAG: T9SS type A sorting domain-containing protein, partial [Candidatus Zixiibacteriota bacterium]
LVDGTVWGGYAGWGGILGDPDCLAGQKVEPLPWNDMWDGGIDIVCADSIDARGDLNLNGIANEIADAVIYTQYFLIGIEAFPEIGTNGRQAAIAASDVNADGSPLTIGDLVYLIRVISGDALPYARLSPFAQDVNVRFDGQVVATESNVNIGAVLLTFKVGENFKVTNLTSLTLGQSLTAGEVKVLLYDISTKSIGSGLRELVRIEGQAELVAAEAADYYGNILTSKLSEGATLPTVFALGQNYPNPFNPETVIEFALPTTGEISLNIYNVAGQLVRTLISGTTPAGYHQIRWGGRDANGSDVSSGVYFYKIDTKDFSETRKMLLVK